ncbi:helix-turn-helix transcriptional regulator [Mangrovicoccus sp. HB161399]|uniref:helix-turn-helix transcriptional regulator n=1 Tax=Mangrovicoccus sp. HB161399 TaxID=2720392 RepID=UPI001555FB45|nr:helix-turn-helix transcriptional regulator [Mangrovicoccus sp. HB161399]
MIRALVTRLGSDRRAATLAAIIILQALCAAYFLSDVVIDLLTGTEESREPVQMALETIASLAMCAGVTALWLQLKRLLAELDALDRGIRMARGEVAQLVDSHFDRWTLTKSERDVALLLLKGLDNKAIAEMRGTAPGTVRAQTAAIYSKAGVEGRADLFCHFMEELMAE